MSSEVNHEGERMETESNPRDVVVDDSENRRQRRKDERIRKTFGYSLLGAACYWAANALVYVGLSITAKDGYNKLIEPLDSAARNMNQYSQVETHLSDDGLEELARLTTGYDELEKELGPSIEAASREFDSKLLRMVFTPVGALFIEGINERDRLRDEQDRLWIKAYEAIQNELSQEQGDREE